MLKFVLILFGICFKIVVIVEIVLGYVLIGLVIIWFKFFNIVWELNLVIILLYDFRLNVSLFLICVVFFFVCLVLYIWFINLYIVFCSLLSLLVFFCLNFKIL